MTYLLDANVFIGLGIGVKCATPFEMLRREQARVILGK